jgi:hypothetical protein
MEHTATPYTFIKRNIEYPNQVIEIRSNPDVSLIATMNGIINSRTGESDVTLPQEENARFICKAVNNYEPMLQALKHIIDLNFEYTRNPAGMNEFRGVVYKLAKDAIEQVGTPK